MSQEERRTFSERLQDRLKKSRQRIQSRFEEIMSPAPKKTKKKRKKKRRDRSNWIKDDADKSSVGTEKGSILDMLHGDTKTKSSNNR